MAPPVVAPPSRLAVHVLVGVLCLVWGSTWIVIQGGLEDLPPFTSAAARFAVAALCMLAIAPWLARREGGERPPRRLVLALGTLNFAASYGIVYWSETVLPSGLTCVLWAVYPMMQAVAGHLFLPGERLVGRQWLGFAVGFLGVALLFRTDLLDIGPHAARAGAILILSPLVSALGNTLIKRGGGGASSALLNRDALVLGALLLAGLAFLTERGERVTWTPSAVASVVYLALMGTVLTFSLFFWLLRYAPAHELSLIAYVTPVVALALGWSVGRERITGFTLAGTALVLGGVGLVARRRAPRVVAAAGEPERAP